MKTTCLSIFVLLITQGAEAGNYIRRRERTQVKISDSWPSPPKTTSARTAKDEEVEFWERFLQGGGGDGSSMSMPTSTVTTSDPVAIPTKSPGLALSTSSPVASPTPAPTTNTPNNSPGSDTSTTTSPTTTPTTVLAVVSTTSPVPTPTMISTNSPVATPMDTTQTPVAALPTVPTTNPVVVTSTPTTSPVADPASTNTISPTATSTTATNSTTTSPTATPTTPALPNVTAAPTTNPDATPTTSPVVADPTTTTSTMSPTVVTTERFTASPTQNTQVTPTTSPVADPTTTTGTMSPTATPTTALTTVTAPTQNTQVTPTTSPVADPTTTGTLSPTATPTTALPTVSAPTQNTQVTPTTSPVADPTTTTGTMSPTATPTNTPEATPTTLLPTVAPTKSPLATPTTSPVVSPIQQACQLRATIDCDRTTTAESSSSCANLSPPPQTQCTGAPLQLRWLYNGKTCSESNTTDTSTFVCDEDNATTAAPTSAYIQVQDMTGQVSYFAGNVQLGSMFAVSNTTAVQRVRVVIAEYDDDPPNQGVGDVWQTMMLDVSCQTTDGLSLLTQYGALQLTAFETNSTGYQSVLESLVMTYSVVNEGSEVVTVQQLDIQTSLFGDNSLVSPPGVEVEANGGVLAYKFTTVQLNMYAVRGETFTNVITVSGVADGDDDATLSCSSTASYNITVGSVNTGFGADEEEEEEEAPVFDLSND